MKGIKKIGKRKAFRIIRQHGRRRTKKLKKLKRWYLLDKSKLNIHESFFDLRTKEGKHLQAIVENKLLSLDWYGLNVGDEVLVGVGERQSKAEREFKKMLSGMLATALRAEGLKA